MTFVGRCRIASRADKEHMCEAIAPVPPSDQFNWTSCGAWQGVPTSASFAEHSGFKKPIVVRNFF